MFVFISAVAEDGPAEVSAEIFAFHFHFHSQKISSFFLLLELFSYLDKGSKDH